MSTIAKKKQPRPAETPAKTPETPAAGKQPMRRVRGRLIVIGVVLLIVAVFVELLPFLVAHTPLLGIMLRRQARLEGALTFKSASLGWLSETSISGVSICDAQGEAVLEADRATCNRGLLRLIVSSANLGKLTIEKPRLTAKLSRDGSNVERVFARWIHGADSPAAAGVDLTLEVADGEATLADTETQQTVRVSNLQLALDLARQDPLPTRVEGSAAFQGELAGLQRWLDKAVGPSAPRLAGRVAGTAHAELIDGKLVCRAENDIEALAVAAPSGESFQDPHVHCAVQCSLQTASGLLTLDQTSLQFSGGTYYGFQLGPGELKTRLVNRTLLADPVRVSCNRGTVCVQGELRMAQQPMEFRLSAGTLADHVQLDPAACRSALRYIVPVLASATQSQGEFSIELDGCRIPLGDLSRAEIGGRVIVHSATMSSGPLVRELTPFFSSPPPLVSIPPETVVLFRMTGGRIYHQGLVLAFPELTVRTFGSVGLDDSLKLMVETSMPLAWLPKNATTDAIRQKKMQIPVGGTLQSPHLDVAELDRVRKQVLGNLVNGVLQSELGNQLNRLIGPKK